MYSGKVVLLDVVDSRLLLVADILLVEVSDTLKLSDEANGADAVKVGVGPGSI